MLSLLFQRSKSNHCVYFKFDNNCILIIALYVDDILLFGNGYLNFDLKSQLLAQFEMKDLSAIRYILGMDTGRDRASKKLWLSQSMYVNSMLEIFTMTTYIFMTVLVALGTNLFVKDCLKCPTTVEDMANIQYMSVLGNLTYSMTYTRPNIAQEL